MALLKIIFRFQIATVQYVALPSAVVPRRFTDGQDLRI